MADFGSATSTSTSGSSGTLTGVVVGSEANRVLYVLLNIGSTSVQASAVTRDGQSATLVNRQAAPAELTQEIWRIVAPNSGTASVSVTLTGSVGELVIGAMSFYGVDQTTPNGAVNANPGASEAAHSLSVTAGGTSDIVVDLLTVSSSGGTSTPGAGQTERIDDASIYWRSLAASTKPGILGSVPMGQTLSVTDNGGNVYSAFVVNNATSGDAEPPVITGPITVTGRTSSGYTLGGWSGSDNLAVTGYERSLDGGGTWTDIGLVTSSTVTGRTPGSTDAVRIRAYDAAGNRSTPLTASVTLRYGGVTGATIVSETATGDDGPGALYDSMRPPSTDARVYEFDVISAPGAGTFTIYNNGSFSLVGAPDGAYSLVLRVWEDGVQLTPDLTHGITVGTPATLATGSASGAWSVRNSVSATRSGAFSVRASVAGSAAGAWSVRNSVSGTQAGAFSVRNYATGSADGAWSVTAGTTIVTGSAGGAWSVRNLASATFSAASSVRNAASATQAGAWSVRAAVSALRSGAWSVRNYAAGSLSAAWSVGGPVTAEWSGAWSVEQQASNSTGGGYGGGRRPKRFYTVEIGGKRRVFLDPTEALAALNADTATEAPQPVEAVEKATPTRKQRKQAAQALKAAPQVVEVPLQPVQEWAALRGMLDQYEAAVEQMRLGELVALVEMMRDEEDVELLLLHA